MVEKTISKYVNIIRLIYVYVTKGNEMKIITDPVKNVYKGIYALTVNSAYIRVQWVFSIY